MARTEYEKTKEICGREFYTLYGMCEQIPGRGKGTHITADTLLKYVHEGCPCFEHSGSLYFQKDLGPFMDWLVQRKPARQRRAMERLNRYR